MLFLLLNMYRANAARIEEIARELHELEVTVAVQSAAESPYSLHNVTMHGLPISEKVHSLLEEKCHCERDNKAVDDFIDSLDPEGQRMMRMKFTDKKRHSNQEIAMKLGYMDESTVRRRIKQFVQNAQKNT